MYKYIVIYVDKYIFLHMNACIYTFIHMCVCVHACVSVCACRERECVSSLWLIMLLGFSLTVHQNYVGTDAEKNPFFLSVVLSDQNNQRIPQYHSILWRKTVRNKYLTAVLTFFCLLVCFFYVSHTLFCFLQNFSI